MAGYGFDGLFVSLDASFDAAVARAEDEAASDLAFSFLQDRALADVFRVRGGRVHLGGALLHIYSLGPDHFRVGPRGGTLVPFRAAVAVADDGDAPPGLEPRSLLEVLRSWCRAGASVQVKTVETTLAGRLVRATSDHVAVVTRSGEAVIAHGAIRAATAISATGEDSADGP
ncbi:MAG: hypothetical protein ABR575_03880 [Actinomycetota bacterium]